MGINQKKENKYASLDQLIEELSFYLNAYANGSVIENEDSSEVSKVKKMLEITQEIYVLENEVALLNELYEEL